MGRKPFTAGLNLKQQEFKVTKREIPVDDHLRTAQPNIYAIGDVRRGAMLATKLKKKVYL